MKIFGKRLDSRQLDESDYRSKNADNVLRLWNSTLQILLPVAALAVIWGRRGLFTRFLLQFDKNCISVLCPSFKDKERLIDWINYYISTKWFFHKDSIENTPIQFWKNGSLLCTLINTAIPGACSNPHRHWEHPPSHGQALAYKYLGVAPVFTDRELTVKYLTEEQKRTLENYINTLQQAVAKASLQDFKFSSTYIAKGMGLVSGEQFRKMCFYIYLNAPTSLNSGDIVINIKAPYNTYHTLSIPSYRIKRKIAQKPIATKKVFNYQSKLQRSLLRSLSVDLGTFINKDSSNKIPIMFTIENDRIKVIYIPQHFGIFEISIITNGFHLLGSPFPVSILENTSNIVDDLNEYDVKTNTKKIVTKKVVSETIDFIDEKIIDKLISTNTFTNTTIAEEDDEEISEKDVFINTENTLLSNLANSKNLTSSICIDHIESEVSNESEPFLILEKNQGKDVCYGNQLSQTSDNTWNIGFDEIKTSEAKYNNDLQVLPENALKTENYNSGENENCSLNILNYLSHFKLDDSMDYNHEHPINSAYKDYYQSRLFLESSTSLNKYDEQSCRDFKEKLDFWKTQSEFDLSDKTRTLKLRCSLPNLDKMHLVNTELSNSSITLEKTWKQECAAKENLTNIYNYSRYSLPNIFENAEKHEILQDRIDDYMEGLEFRDKFRKCLEYWEKLCSDSSSIDNLSLHQSSTDDDNDSGFEYSLTNSDLLYNNEYLLSLFADAYNRATFEERRKYWEKLSSLNPNDSKKIKNKKPITKRNDSELRKTKERLLKSFKKLNFFKDNKNHYLTFEDDLQHNLTDDLKSIKNYRENIKIRFNKNKQFFKSLENVVR